MSKSGSPSLAYTRQSLRKSTKFTEGDYRGINPREFFRSLSRTLGEIQKGNDFKYTTYGGPNDSLSIESEDVGSKTGVVEGRLVANSDFENIGGGSIGYRRYGPHGAWLIIIGILTSIFLVGLILIPIGLYLYLKETRGRLPILRQDAIRVLMTGEVSERTIEEEDEERTDIFANISVIYAGDTFIKIDSAELRELDLAHRKKILNETKRIFNGIIEHEDQKRDFYSGMVGEFIGHLASVANLEVDIDIQEIGEMQSVMNGKFEYRIEYSESLLRFLPEGHENELEDHQDAVMEELEDLAQDMDIFVEREGLENA